MVGGVQGSVGSQPPVKVRYWPRPGPVFAETLPLIALGHSKASVPVDLLIPLEGGFTEDYPSASYRTVDGLQPQYLDSEESYH